MAPIGDAFAEQRRRQQGPMADDLLEPPTVRVVRLDSGREVVRRGSSRRFRTGPPGHGRAR